MSGFVCDRCGDRCEVVETYEHDFLEIWGARVIHTFTNLISECCGDDVREIDEDDNADIRLRDRRPT